MKRKREKPLIKLLKISSDKRKKIEAHFSEEIREALSGRDGFHSKCAKWRKNFEAEPEREIKNFPWEKASNLVIPIQAITVNAYVARQLNTVFSFPPFWTANPLNPQWTDHVVPTQNCLHFYQKNDLKLEKVLVDYSYDQGNIGTAIAKEVWVSEVVDDKIYDDSGEVVDASYLDEGPRFIPIAIEDAIFPIDSIQDIQREPWIAHRFRISWSKIEARSRKIQTTGEPIYVNTEDLKSKYIQLASTRVEKQEEIEKLARGMLLQEHELFEVWCDYDYDEDGKQEKCCFTFHNAAASPDQTDFTLIRPILNPWSHRLRPFLVSQCFPRPHRALGIGFGQRLERLQEGLSTTANQGIDNWSVTNAKLFTYKKGLGIKTPFKIWPGRAIAVSEHTDINAIEMGSEYTSGQIIMNFLKDVSERVTGVSDYWLGRESSTVGSSATATSTLALIQEGTKLFDFLLKNTRTTLNEGAFILYMLLKQFKPSGAVYSFMGEEAGKLVEDTWKAKDGDVKKNLEFDLTCSSAVSNRMMERQSWMEYFNLVMGYYERIFEASGVFFDPQAPLELKLTVAEMILSAHLIMQRISQHWDIKDANRIIFDPSGLIQTEMQKAQLLAQPQLGGQPNGQTINQGRGRGFRRSSSSSRVEGGTGRA